MKRSVLSLLIVGIAIVAILIAGCQTAGNTNHNANANANANANTPVPRNENVNTGARDRGISREDFERQKERFQREARDLGRKIGSGADDLWIWTKVRTALATAEDLSDSTINVDVDNNVATLSGTVPSQAQKARAEEVARDVEGLKSVKNNLQVSPQGANRNRNAR
jgi:hypothetical protein